MARKNAADREGPLGSAAPTETKKRRANDVRPYDERGRAMPVPADGSVWEMKKRGSVGVISTVPFCGYSEATLRSLRERGWHLYKDGKRVD